jgi:acetyl-CoA C-acetyltransferase
MFPGQEMGWTGKHRDTIETRMSEPKRTAVIVGAARTRSDGSWAAWLRSAPELGGIAIRAALERSGIDAAELDERRDGERGIGGARPGAGKAGRHQGREVPTNVGAMAVSRVCGSGLQAVMLAAQAVRAEDARVMLAGGMESMSNVPYYLLGHRAGVKFGNQELIDGLIHDGLICAFDACHMGGHAEYTAWKAGVTRGEADEFSYRSHQKAIAAIDNGAFQKEIVPVEIKGRKSVTVVAVDKPPRRDTALASLAALKPAFVKDMPKEVTDSGHRGQRARAERRRGRGSGDERGVCAGTGWRSGAVNAYATSAVAPRRLSSRPCGQCSG